MRGNFQRLAIALLIFAVSGGAIWAGEDLNRHSINANGVKISYLVEGKGEPVVLIHGLHSSSVMNWQMPGILPSLAKDHLVIAIDMPGHGQSDKPENEDAYGVEMVEDVVRVLDAEKIQKAHIVGYSMGGLIAAKMMVKHEDRVLSVTLGGMGWLKDGSPLQKSWESMGKRGGMTPAACVQSFGKLAISEDEIKAVKVPVQVLVGDRDPCKKLYVEPLQKARADWLVTVIEDAGHINCVTKPEFKDGIAKWLQKPAAK